MSVNHAKEAAKPTAHLRFVVTTEGKRMLQQRWEWTVLEWSPCNMQDFQTKHEWRDVESVSEGEALMPEWELRNRVAHELMKGGTGSFAAMAEKVLSIIRKTHKVEPK